MRHAIAPVFALLCVTGAQAWAADVTDVASSFDEGNKFDFRFRLSYDHMEKRAQIKREVEELSPTQDTIATRKDLVYDQHRDTVRLRAEFGLFHDLMLHFELPIIIEEQESYSFDQSAGKNCIFPGDPGGATPTCVNQSNSTTMLDGLVPVGGYDATLMGRSLPPGPGVFRGVLRGARGGSGLDGFDTFNVGLTFAPFSQARDDTKPTWSIALEGQFSIGNIKQFNRGVPDANHAVSEGVHRLIARTGLSKRFKYLDPYWELWYLLPIARGDSLFKDYGPQQKTKNPMMQGGTYFGLEIVPIDRPVQQYKFTIDLSGRIEGHFTGRGYSEAWEMLASADVLRCDASTAGYNPACDPAQVKNQYQNQPFTGVTTIQNYATVGTGA